MPRKKAACNCKFLPWLSVKGREGRFLQIGNSLMLCKNFQALSTGARWLYFCVANEAGGRHETEFSHSTARKYEISASSFDRWIRELQKGGFVELLESPDRAQFLPNKFRFSLAWKESEKSDPPIKESK